MDLSSSSLRSPDVGGPDPAIMLFGKRIQGRPSTIDAADIKEELSPRGVDEGGAVSCGTTSSDEEEDLSSSQNVGTNKDEIKATGGEAKAKGTGGELKVETEEKQVRCPRCSSADTKFCYFNNYNVNQPRHFCKRCQRYWTAGGTLRNVPVGAGKRKSKHSVSSRQAFPPLAAVHSHSAAPPTNLTSFLAHSVNTNLDLFAGPRPNPQCTVFSTEIKGPLPNLQLEPPELGVTNPIPQIGSSGLHEIKADSQTRFFRLGEINPNLQSEFSRLGEINANLQSGSCGSGKKNVNLQSGFSGLGEINSNLKTGFPGLGGIKANLQSGFHGLGANHQSGFSRLDQNKANLQSGLDQNKANLHIECPESNTIKPNSHSGGNESREMKGYLQWSSEIEPSGCSGLSESKARLAAGECNGLSQIKAPHLCFHSDEPHLISLSNSTEGGVNTKSLEGCYEAQGSWCSGQVLPVLGGLWPCFYNMYWADGGGKPQQGIMPHLAPVLTPPGWGVSCVGAMATPISSSFAATAPCMATTADPPISPQLPPPAMLGKNGNVPTNTTSATTTLGKRAAQHGSILQELGGLFCNSKSSKVCDQEPSTTTSRSPNSTTLVAIAQAPTRVAFT